VARVSFVLTSVGRARMVWNYLEGKSGAGQYPQHTPTAEPTPSACARNYSWRAGSPTGGAFAGCRAPANSPLPRPKPHRHPRHCTSEHFYLYQIVPGRATVFLSLVHSIGAVPCLLDMWKLRTFRDCRATRPLGDGIRCRYQDETLVPFLGSEAPEI